MTATRHRLHRSGLQTSLSAYTHVGADTNWAKMVKDNADDDEDDHDDGVDDDDDDDDDDAEDVDKLLCFPQNLILSKNY